MTVYCEKWSVVEMHPSALYCFSSSAQNFIIIFFQALISD